MTADNYLLISDIVGVVIVGGVGLWGMKYFFHALRDEEFRNLRYIWEPNVLSGAFFFIMVVGLLINDLFGTFIDTPYYFSIHPFFLIASFFFALSVFRFANTVKKMLDNKRRAEKTLSLDQMTSDLRERSQKSAPRETPTH